MTAVTELTELTTLERACCAFAVCAIPLDGDQLLLDVSADTNEGVAAVQAVFGNPHAGLPPRQRR
jgi:hypothetical protein